MAKEIRVRLSRVIIGAALIALVMATAACSPSDSNASSAKVGSPVSRNLMAMLKKVSLDSLKQKIEAPKDKLQPIEGPALAAEQQSGVLYLGADFCPNCATLRWPLVLALFRFGSFDSLHYMRSSSHDAFPDTVTFGFRNSKYHSRYLNFRHVDIADRSGKVLETPSDEERALFRKFDKGGIPFLYIGGRYVEVGAPFMPTLLHGLSWSQVVNKVQQHGALSRQILGAANLYTAAFCRVTKGEPRRVCSSTAIEAASAELPE